MGLFSWLFKKKNNTITCPRCMGKGRVDKEDIKRLQMELKWRPGSCAYCNGTGKVSPTMLDNVAVDEAYLTVELTSRERMKLINKDPEAIMRAVGHVQNIENAIERIKFLHFVKKMEADEIAAYFLQSAPDMEYDIYMQEKKELIAYINEVIFANDSPTN